MTSFNVPLLASAALLPPPTLRFDGVAFNQQGKALLRFKTAVKARSESKILKQRILMKIMSVKRAEQTQ